MGMVSALAIHAMSSVHKLTPSPWQGDTSPQTASVVYLAPVTGAESRVEAQGRHHAVACQGDRVHWWLEVGVGAQGTEYRKLTSKTYWIIFMDVMVHSRL